MPGQARAVGAGALHPDPGQLTEALQPPSQGRIARRGRRELVVTRLPAQMVDHRDMMGLAMGVNATDDNAGFTGHARHCCTSSARTGWVSALRSGATDKTVMGASRTGSYQVTPPGRTRRRHRPRRGRPTLAKTATSRHSNGGHTPSERCRLHPISLVGSDTGAVSGLPRVRFPCPPAEPGVPISRHRALRVSFPLVSRWWWFAVSGSRGSGFCCRGSGSGSPRRWLRR
jgi:hypothetical protein